MDMKPAWLDATCLIFLYSKLWGMFPYSLVDGWKLQTSKRALFHSFIMVTFSIVSCCKSMMSSKTRLYNFIFLTELFSLNLTIVSSVLMLILRYRHISDALFLVLSVQRRYGIRLRSRRCLKQIYACSLFLLSIFFYR